MGSPPLVYLSSYSPEFIIVYSLGSFEVKHAAVVLLSDQAHLSGYTKRRHTGVVPGFREPGGIVATDSCHVYYALTAKCIEQERQGT